MASDTPTAVAAGTVWTDEKIARLSRLYPHVRTKDELRALAAELGVTDTAARSQAKRMKLRRAPGPGAQRTWTVDEDAVLRQCVEDAGDEPAGIADAARALRIPEPQVRTRWALLERRRAARVGTWTERELHEAVGDRAQGVPVERTAQRLGRDSEDLRLKLLALGVRAEHAAERRLTVGQAASKLGVGVDDLVDAVARGHLSALPATGCPPFPCASWVTTDLRLGAYLAAFPERLDLSSADTTFVLRIAFHAGARVAAKMTPKPS